jgi:hypothetical protein
MLSLAAASTHLQVVAGLPLELPWGSVRLPWWTASVVLPLSAIALAIWRLWSQRATPQRTVSSSCPSVVAVAAIALAALGVLAIWLVHLARHDRLLTAMHVGVTVLLLGCAMPRGTARWLAAALAAATLAMLSYGAIWGETRCDEPDPLGCLADRGPRITVPGLLEGLGVPVFANLRDADLRGVDLSGRDLRLADLRGAQLEAAQFGEANLRRARLDGAKAQASVWRGAYLDGASMRGAHLVRADLRGVHAFHVDLGGAVLVGADARGASLSHARLDGAQLDGLRSQGAYLRFSTGWSSAQLATIDRDAATRLPDGANLPTLR